MGLEYFVIGFAGFVLEMGFSEFLGSVLVSFWVLGCVWFGFVLGSMGL